jgi:SAM-dependent methyltransferase
MSGVRMGERLLGAGSSEAAMFTALAAKVGLSGRACAVAEDAPAAERFTRAAAREGVLVEVETAPADRLPFDADSFDLALLAGSPAYLGTKQALLGEVHRLLRHGGRVLIVSRTGSGLAALFSGGRGRVQPDQMLASAGFRPVRKLARQKGLLFVEGLKTSN